MALIDTLFDLLSAATGAILGAVATYALNHRRGKIMANQLVVSKSALEKIKLENQKLLEKIQEKENLILKMQVELMGDKVNDKQKKKK